MCPPKPRQTAKIIHSLIQRDLNLSAANMMAFQPGRHPSTLRQAQDRLRPLSPWEDVQPRKGLHNEPR